MPSEQPASTSPAEFRRYRRFLSWLVLGFVSLGSAYMLVSVGVTIYRRRNAVPSGAPIGALASPGDVQGCHEEVSVVEQALERHLENFHNLLAHYDAAEAQRWAESESFWLGQWKAAGERCRFAEPRKGPLAKSWAELGAIYDELKDTEATYTKELQRFARHQAPRLDQMRERLKAVGRRIGTTIAAPASGATQP
jgi:hypothetical protein